MFKNHTCLALYDGQHSEGNKDRRQLHGEAPNEVHFAVILRRFGLRAVAAFAAFKRVVIASR